MEDSKKRYHITVKNQIVSFACTDGQEFVDSLEAKVNEVVEAIAPHAKSHILSDLALKMAVALASEMLSEEKKLSDKKIEMNNRFEPLLTKLEGLIEESRTLMAETPILS